MNNQEHASIPHSGCNIPEDAIMYHNCGCNQHQKPPEKIGTFNMDTNTLSVVLTGEL
jgi:hypothetical protein